MIYCEFTVVGKWKTYEQASQDQSTSVSLKTAAAVVPPRARESTSAA